MTLMPIGFGSFLSRERVIGIVRPDSAPMKRLIQESRERGMLVDATYGRKTASVFIMDSDHVILSAWPPEKFEGEAGWDTDAPVPGEDWNRQKPETG